MLYVLVPWRFGGFAGLIIFLLTGYVHWSLKRRFCSNGDKLKKCDVARGRTQTRFCLKPRSFKPRFKTVTVRTLLHFSTSPFQTQLLSAHHVQCPSHRNLQR